ncbi:MAG TPA: hypothetical protein VGF30_02785 [Bacteroidia bacterium]
MSILIIFFLLIVLLSIYLYNKKFASATFEIISEIEKIDDKLVFRNVYCTFKSIGSIQLTSCNVYIFNDSIVIHEAVTQLVNQKYHQMRAPTYIISKSFPKILDLKLFRGNVLNPTITVSDRGKIKIQGEMQIQNSIEAIGFENSYSNTIIISTNISTEKLKNRLVDYHIL